MTVHDGFPTDTVPWGGFREQQGLPPAPTEAEWVERVARPATPLIEYDDHGGFRQWINPPERPTPLRAGDRDLAGGLGTTASRDAGRRLPGSPVADPSLAVAGADPLPHRLSAR